MTAEHVGEGLLAVLRGDLDARAGFARDLEQAAGVRVCAINLEWQDDGTTHIEIEVHGKGRTT